MEHNLLDRSNYFKGLLLLVASDNKITENEKTALRTLAKELDFNQSFVNKAIEDFFENEFLSYDPPIFSNDEFAKIFTKDAIRVAFSDKTLHIYEIDWLNNFVIKNNISKEWFVNELEIFLNNYELYDLGDFEIQKHLQN
ncbi:MAG: hypothetical protein CVV23_12540 [Ignavibacteriae bacterium HGW-Ignavibacteriae-2]|jgi:hypothetical protein|nr:TerB family tellurite resistance protein [Bacteroidota bacterium]PKL87993.1 MAG: hypothetical protein CVV23_12540 [Ignavibacteriae bacterium HGW-Ignavibacteriae-2]